MPALKIRGFVLHSLVTWNYFNWPINFNKNYVAIAQIQIKNSMGEIVEHEILVGNNSEGMYKIVLTESGSN